MKTKKSRHEDIMDRQGSKTKVVWEKNPAAQLVTCRKSRETDAQEQKKFCRSKSAYPMFLDADFLQADSKFRDDHGCALGSGPCCPQSEYITMWLQSSSALHVWHRPRNC